MAFNKSTWTVYGSTTLFVLLWGSGAIVSKWALDHASAFMFLVLRFALALTALLLLGLRNRRWPPSPGTRVRIALTGLLLIGGYSSCYFLALAHGVTPGVLATVMGVQPILTLVVLERRLQTPRVVGLLLAFSGLVLVVYNSIIAAHFSLTGISFALGALISMTIGAILQKRVQQAPSEVLPLQYAASLGLCLILMPVQPAHLQITVSFLMSWLWLGLVFSVAAQLLFYRLIQRGNLVNVTSLFYLVPVMTAALDYFLLGNILPVQSLLGMAAILFGLVLVFRRPAMISSAT
jgi:drug/metabolite transporter (DMT)-like permease